MNYYLSKYLIMWGAIRVLGGVGIVLGSKAVHQFVDQVQDPHPHGNAVFLRAFEADKKCIETVGTLVTLDSHA